QQVNQRCMLLKLSALAVDRDLMEKRLAVHCGWLRQASLVHAGSRAFCNDTSEFWGSNTVLGGNK
ncbi:MAG: hypothetical protein ABSA94_11900, partial [Acidobacteriaceae bacterium]